MIITNEQIATAINKAPDVIRASLKDVEVYLKDVHKQITYSVHEGVNTAVERMHLDVEGLLIPIEVFLWKKNSLKTFVSHQILINYLENQYKKIWKLTLILKRLLK